MQVVIINMTNIRNGGKGEVKLTPKDVMHIAKRWVDCEDPWTTLLGDPKMGRCMTEFRGTPYHTKSMSR